MKQPEIRTYKKSECVSFKSTKQKYGSLSNMASGFCIFINGFTIKTSEALYQALKFPLNPEIQKKIIDSHSPMTAKKISRYYDVLKRPDWDFIRFKIMKFCIQVKLLQNYNLFSSILLETNEQSIVEFTYKDKVWGVVSIGDNYIGTNALGRLLMELRENVKNDTFNVDIPSIDFLLLFDEEITHNSFNITNKEHIQKDLML